MRIRKEPDGIAKVKETKIKTHQKDRTQWLEEQHKVRNNKGCYWNRRIFEIECMLCIYDDQLKKQIVI